MGMEGGSINCADNCKTNDSHKNRARVYFSPLLQTKWKELGSKVSTAITNQIWEDVMIIEKEEAMDESDDFAKEIMDAMNVDHDCWDCFWMYFVEDERKR